MELICDTNVWYSIAFGTLDPHSVKSAGHTLAASSVNWMELSSDLTEQNFERKKLAAAAALAHADSYLPDTERYLADIWGIELPPLNFTCRDVLAAVSSANAASGLSRSPWSRSTMPSNPATPSTKAAIPTQVAVGSERKSDSASRPTMRTCM